MPYKRVISTTKKEDSVMPIDRPVFILGTGRSGTTLFFNVLSFHPEFAWFSTYSQKFPGHPSVALLSRIHNLPLFGQLVSKSSKYIPRPIESYAMLNYCTESLFTSRRMLDASDVTDSTLKLYRRTVAAFVRWQEKRRFIQKHTGFGRIRYLRAIFPDALFIHIYRDGRAVANSMNKVNWWQGNLDAWWWTDMKASYMEEYMVTGKDPIILAGIVWKTLMDLIEEECNELPETQLMRIRYDEMVTDLLGTMKKVICFCALSDSQRFERHVNSTRVANMDTKWVRMLSSQQQKLLERYIGDHLEKYGFRL